jgi:hypothetical protein
LAGYKAARFPAGKTVADLCCGIGGDLIALARRGAVVGIELDPLVAILASANLRAIGCDGHVTVDDAATFDVRQCSGWHCDPDRRATGKRTTRVEQFAPPLESLKALQRQQFAAAVKLAPATEAPRGWTEQAELEWLGSRGECRQQVAWFNGLARYPGRRAATIMEADEARTVVGDADQDLPVAASCGRYVFEPHAAVLAAKLTAALGREHALTAISPAVAYLSGDKQVQDAALAAFEVQDVLPFDRKRLKAYCRERGLGRLEVKKRGVDVDPNRLALELAASGDEQAVILLAPLNGKVAAIVARRVL